MIVTEFKNINELNDYLAITENRVVGVIPVPRNFINPTTNLLTCTMTYVLTEEERLK